MFELVDPHPRFHRSFLEAVEEFIAADEERHANLVCWPADESFSGVTFTREALESSEEFTSYAAFLLAQRIAGASRPSSYVSWTELWMADGEEYLGRISLRHELTPLLLTWGGHVGYAVRPSARGKGYAARALALILPGCAELEIDPVLVTCDVDNVASRRTVEKNDGAYEDTREGKLRFWVPTS